MKLFQILLVASTFTSSLILSSCKKNLTEELPAVAQEFKNLSYGTDANQKLDLYLPANRTTTDTKVLMFIHGGSWNAGDKADFDTAVPFLRPQLQDYALVNINYRLANSGNSSTQFPAQINDVQAAVDFITSKASEYKINPNKIVLLGFSAGAHLALLQAYKNNSSGRIKAVIDLFGPTDLVTLFNNHPFPPASQPVLVNFLGATPTSNPIIYRDASPINFVTNQSVPTQIFHGALDFVVPISQSNALKSKLEASNVKVEMVVYPTEDHGWFGANLIDTYVKAIAFIKTNVQ